MSGIVFEGGSDAFGGIPDGLTAATPRSQDVPKPIEVQVRTPAQSQQTSSRDGGLPSQEELPLRACGEVVLKDRAAVEVLAHDGRGGAHPGEIGERGLVEARARGCRGAGCKGEAECDGLLEGHHSCRVNVQAY